MKTSVLTIAAATLLSGCVIYVGNGHAGDLQHEERTLALGAADLTQLVADTGAGKLDIIGEEGRSDVEVVANIYYYDAEDVRLSLVDSGSNAKLEAGFDKSFYSGNSPYIDLTVKVPARFSLKLDDGSGDTDIRGLKGDLYVDDGSGDLQIQGGANAVIEDGSGNLSIRQLSGKLQVEDGSGDLHISDVAGDVSIDDGSGDLTVNNIGGTVTVDDGSGDILVDGAAGLTVVNSGSGGLKINAINGPVKIND